MRAGFLRVFTLSLAAVSLAAHTQPLQAATAEGDTVRASEFFGGKGSVLDVFGDPLENNEKPELGYFPEKKKIEFDDLDRQSVNAAKLEVKDIKSADQVLQAFGNPEDEPKLNPVENAPAPFKGMVAALQVGDEKLAFQYAKQYAKYVGKVSSATSRVSSMTGLAMEEQGIVAKGSSAASVSDRQLFGVDSSMPVPELSEQDLKLASLYRKARQETAGEQQEESGPKRVYFFFDNGDSQSREMARRIEQVYRASSGEPVVVVGLSTKEISTAELEEFKVSTGASYSIRSGVALAKGLGVVSSPSVLVLNEEGRMTSSFGGRASADEILSVVRGGEE